MNIEVERSAKVFSEEEIIINAPIEKTYRILADINNWPKWQSAVNEAIINEKPAEGTLFQWRTGRFKIVSRLHTVKPVIEFGWTGMMGWINAVHNWYFEKFGNSTRVKVEESMNGFGASLLKKSLRKGMKKSLTELKKAAESV